MTDLISREAALLPCPFCGGTDLQIGRSVSYVLCRTCLADGPLHAGDNATAITAWNSRALPAQAPAVIGDQKPFGWWLKDKLSDSDGFIYRNPERLKIAQPPEEWIVTPLYALPPAVPCLCTLIEQDDDCPIGQPSPLCGVCSGTGNTTPDKVQALAAEMLRIVIDLGEPEDPFAAWEKLQGGAEQSPAVKVKPLVWVDEGRAHSAITQIGEYRAANIHGEWMWFFAWMPRSNEDEVSKGKAEPNTIEAAKAASQADYEARILAAIEPVTAQPLDDAPQS